MTTAEAERDAFEAWAKSERGGLPIKRCGDSYDSMFTAGAWYAFRALSPTARAEPLIEALREIAFLGLDRPAAMGGTDDAQDAHWYRSRAHAAIGIAARAIAALGEKAPTQEKQPC